MKKQKKKQLEKNRAHIQTLFSTTGQIVTCCVKSVLDLVVTIWLFSNAHFTECDFYSYRFCFFFFFIFVSSVRTLNWVKWNTRYHICLKCSRLLDSDAPLCDSFRSNKRKKKNWNRTHFSHCSKCHVFISTRYRETENQLNELWV